MIKKLLSKYKAMPIQVKASFWFLICGFLQKGVSVIITPIFTRLLTTTEYGQYSVFNSWLGIITVFVSLQLYSGVFTQGLVKYDRRKNEYASSLQGLTLTLVICWTIVYLLLHNFWNNLFGLTTVQMFAMLVMIWTNSVFSFWSVQQRVDLKYKTLVLITIITTIAKPTVGIVFVLLAEDKVIARILGLVLVELICYTWMFFYHMHEGKKFFVKEFWKHALIFNLPLIPHYLSMTALNSSDRIMIESMVGADKAGIYSLAYSLSQIMLIFNSALSSTIDPWLYRKIKAKQFGNMATVAYPAFIVIAAVNILLIAFAPEAVAIFAPAEYYEAIWVIPPIAMSVYFMFGYSFFAVFEFYYEKIKYVAVATTSGALLNIGLNYVFIKIFGYYAAGYTTFVCYIFFVVYHYLFMKRVCRKELGITSPYSTKKLLIITGAFMGLGFAFLITYHSTIIRYIFIAILFIIVIIKRKLLFSMIKGILATKQSAEE